MNSTTSRISDRLWGLEKANTIHLRLRNSKGGAADGRTQCMVGNTLWRGGLSERRIAPFGCEAVVKPSSAICQMQCDYWICGRFVDRYLVADNQGITLHPFPPFPTSFLIDPPQSPRA
jgi:hypothetical protein